MTLESTTAEGFVDLSHPDSSELKRGRSRLFEALWHFAGRPLLGSQMIPFSGFRTWLLRAFGARIGKGVYIKPGLKVKFPWYLTVGDYSWLGEDLWIDNLAAVAIGSNACVSQGVYLCTGNHDWTTRNLKLFTRPIAIEAGAWVGARSVVCPGVTVGRCSIVTAGSVATRSVPAFEIHGGNPAVFLRPRPAPGRPPA
ncbi:MAG: colanic acid biosynthesis acetyltransferase WcaF [Gemmataceae bacterium]|nr:colanic acid biosynthesis acetyltransferase WcaF [Gemmataceae bacterium]